MAGGALPPPEGGAGDRVDLARRDDARGVGFGSGMSQADGPVEATGAGAEGEDAESAHGMLTLRTQRDRTLAPDAAGRP